MSRESDRGPAGGLRDGQPQLASLLDLHGDPAIGNASADLLSDPPGPNTRSLTGTLQLIE